MRPSHRYRYRRDPERMRSLFFGWWAARYVRRSLRRRIFWWLAASILATGVVMSVIFHLTKATGGGRHVVLPLVIFGLMLWAASGRIAQRLARPYSELARVARDIGAGRLSSRYELPRRDAADEARMLADSINDMAARIEKQMADQRELLAAVSHEIRTPLSRIRLLVELARTAGSGGLDPKTLDELDREVTEIDALVGELLASSRLDFAAVSPRTLDAADVARRALERAALDPSRLRVETERTSFTGDPTLLARALANLLDNAASHGGGVDQLRVASSAGHIVFEALDRGPGFAPGEEEKVFESFYQRPGDAAREKGSLGLGLTLVRRIAVAHGGRAYARSREGGGARVGIELPLEGATARG